MRLMIYGSRSFATTVADLARDCGHEVAGMVDDVHSGAGVIGDLASALNEFEDCGIVLGIGYRDLSGRWNAWQRMKATGRPTPALVHPRAYVARTAHVEAGCVVMAGAIVDRAARLGEAVVVWPGACINHDCIVEGNCFISPNATLCGYARVGAGSFIGAGAAVVDHGLVPESSYVRMLERYTIKAPA